MMDYVIGCDIGSQGTKAILLSTSGEFVCEAYSGYPTEYPRPLWAEQPVEHWLNALTLTVRQLLSKSDVVPERIRALGLATQVDGVVPVDSGGKALRPAIIWMDRRAVSQCESVRQHLDDNRIFNLTGLNLDASHVAPKIRWLADQQPQIYERAAHFLLPGCYIAYVLTGEIRVDYSNASSTLLLDVKTRTWSPTMLDAFGIEADKLAPIDSAAAILGKLRPEFAEQLGLTPDTFIMVGCGDEHAACLGAGVNSPGVAGDIAGTAEPVCAASRSPIFDHTRLVETHCHADPELWLLENPGFVSGGSYRWFRDQFAAEESFASLDSQAAQVVPGSEGLVFLPNLMGSLAPTWNESARGVYAGITLAHTRAHFVRALLEGTAYAVRDITAQMQVLGLELNELRVMGGGARSQLWNRIKANVTGLPVTVPEITETTALGAAFLALVGIGAFATLTEASEHIVRIHERIYPDPGTMSLYMDMYEMYRETYFAMLPVFEKAAESRG